MWPPIHGSISLIPSNTGAVLVALIISAGLLRSDPHRYEVTSPGGQTRPENVSYPSSIYLFKCLKAIPFFFLLVLFVSVHDWCGHLRRFGLDFIVTAQLEGIIRPFQTSVQLSWEMSSVAASRLSEQLELRVVGHPRGSGTGPQPKLETGQPTFFSSDPMPIRNGWFRHKGSFFILIL